MSNRKQQAASVNQNLTLRIVLGDSKNTAVFLKMTRVDAQDLIDALSEYTGRKSASAHRSGSTWIAGEVGMITDADRVRTTEKLMRRAP